MHLDWSHLGFVLKQGENPSYVWICRISPVRSDAGSVMPTNFAFALMSESLTIAGPP
jgi:hypothetical protein